jgi:3-methyladenine DNA glycosylase Mpg
VRLRRLRRAELPDDTIALARFLIGKVVVHDVGGERLSGRIVETEAYPVGDAAGHAFRGQTRRNASLFLRRGHAYVYFAYGSCFMLNVSSERAGVGAGVLLRAVEPLDGIDTMQRARGVSRLVDLTALACVVRASDRRTRGECSDRHLARNGPPLALLRTRQPVRQRAETAADVTVVSPSSLNAGAGVPSRRAGAR